MVKEDIHDLKGILDRNSEKYILQLLPDDQEDVRRFTNDLLAQGYTAGRVVKYLYSLVSIRKKLEAPFQCAKEEDMKRLIAGLERSDYAEWTKHDLKVILKKYLQWLVRVHTRNILYWENNLDILDMMKKNRNH